LPGDRRDSEGSHYIIVGILSPVVILSEAKDLSPQIRRPDGSALRVTEALGLRPRPPL